MRYQFERDAEAATMVVSGKEEEGEKYKDYFEFNKLLKYVSPHQFLAIQRAEREGIIRFSLEPEEDNTVYQLERLFLKKQNAHLKVAIKDAYKRLLKPSIATEFKGKHKTHADDVSIQIFEKNLLTAFDSSKSLRKWKISKFFLSTSRP